MHEERISLKLYRVKGAGDNDGDEADTGEPLRGKVGQFRIMEAIIVDFHWDANQVSIPLIHAYNMSLPQFPRFTAAQTGREDDDDTKGKQGSMAFVCV